MIFFIIFCFINVFPPDIKWQAALRFPPFSMGSHNKRLELGVAQGDIALDLVLVHVPQLQRALNPTHFQVPSCFCPHLVLSFVAEVGLAQRGEEEVQPRHRLQRHRARGGRVLEVPE